MNRAAQILKTRSTFLKYKTFQCRTLTSPATQSQQQETTPESISIPKRIPREPTDILRALESTIKRDPTAAHYKYHDDPYLIPMSNLGKRTFALAQESGRKTAHWVRAQHANLFQHKECDPPIEMFFPKMVYNEKSDVTEDDLKNVIQNVLVSDAVMVYKLLKEKGVEISDGTRQEFLDLLCYFNHEDAISEEFIEERWYKQSTGKEKARKTWKDGELAEELFISIDTPNAEIYSSLISGMAKHYQVDRAWQLFQEAQDKQLVLNVNAYNSIIKVANFLKESYDMRWIFVKDVLTMMASAKIQPNLGTMHAVLEILSTMGSSRNTREQALKTIKEFQLLGVQPSLATWYYLLITYCKERGTTSFILKDILPHIENREHTIMDIKDTNFFVTAMDVCRNHLHDRELALRVNALLHHGNNYDLIGDSFKESIYYRHYFLLMADTMPLDEFISNVYECLVPHIYVPEPAVMTEILKNVELNAATGYLPKLWSDMTVFDHLDREVLLTMVLNIMVTNKPPEGDKLVESFANIGWGVWNKISNQSENRIHKLAFTGEMLGNILTVVLWNNDFEKATLVMRKLDKDIHSVVGVPNIEALSLFIDVCIREKSPSSALECIQYCTDNGFPESEEFAERIRKNLTLDEFDDEKLSKLISLSGLAGSSRKSSSFSNSSTDETGNNTNTQRKKRKNKMQSVSETLMESTEK